MNVRIGDDTYKVWWSYTDVNRAIKTKIGTGMITLRATSLNLERNLLGGTSVTTVTCHSETNFSKNVGRRAALAKMLKDLRFDKDARKRFWEAYREQLGHW